MLDWDLLCVLHTLQTVKELCPLHCHPSLDALVQSQVSAMVDVSAKTAILLHANK